MVEYRVYDSSLDRVDLSDGFFEGWPNPPSKVVHRAILTNSYKSFVAIDINANQIVGFINVISDGVLSAYIPLLEVVPAYRNRGVGRSLLQLAISSCQNLYMIDLLCDKEMIPFYEKEGMHRAEAMLSRNYQNQSGFSE